MSSWEGSATEAIASPKIHPSHAEASDLPEGACAGHLPACPSAFKRRHMCAGRLTFFPFHPIHLHSTLRKGTSQNSAQRCFANLESDAFSSELPKDRSRYMGGRASNRTVDGDTNLANIYEENTRVCAMVIHDVLTQLTCKP